MTYAGLTAIISELAGTESGEKLKIKKEKLQELVKKTAGSLAKLQIKIKDARALDALGQPFDALIPTSSAEDTAEVRGLLSKVPYIPREKDIAGFEEEAEYGVNEADVEIENIATKHAIPMEKVIPIAELADRDETYYPNKVKIPKRVKVSNIVEAPVPIQIKKEGINKTASVNSVLKKIDNVDPQQQKVQLKSYNENAIGDMLKKLGF